MIADWPNILLFRVFCYRKICVCLPYLDGRNNNPVIPVFFGVVFVKDTRTFQLDTMYKRAKSALGLGYMVFSRNSEITLSSFFYFQLLWVRPHWDGEKMLLLPRGEKCVIANLKKCCQT